MVHTDLFSWTDLAVYGELTDEDAADIVAALREEFESLWD